ncbi:MAG TPA: glycosyltransferase family 9 protein [Candidatus Dormibacteraeota bacterium]|nr:glycosyltransferase family 9 protein [Candidatus Dormibacteraeota bacterium]
MTLETRPSPRVAIVLGGGVREALMALPLVRACDGATVFASSDAVGALIGRPEVGRSVVIGDSIVDLVRLFGRLRTGAISTAVLPYPAALTHSALIYFAGIPRRLIASGPGVWAASERIPDADALHPVEANWRLALTASHRPMRSLTDGPRVTPPDAVRRQVLARLSAFLGGRRPLLLIPGGGGWSAVRSGPLWPAERFAVVANQSAAERILLLSGAGDQRAIRETRAGIVKPTTVLALPDLTVEEVAAISELSLAVIGHDGDALHVAAAAGALVLAIGRRGDIAPMAEHVVTCWVDDYERFPARQVVETLSAQARVDSYA